jgi:hypothetical protein
MPQGLRKTRTSQIPNHRWKENIKIGVEINNMEVKRTLQIVNETKSEFFKKINKIDKPFAKLTKRKKEKT